MTPAHPPVGSCSAASAALAHRLPAVAAEIERARQLGGDGRGVDGEEVGRHRVAGHAHGRLLTTVTYSAVR